jgi:hypothetical protein
MEDNALNNPARAEVVEVETIVFRVGITCTPSNHKWAYDAPDDAHPDFQEPPTENVCICGQKYWVRSSLYPHIHGHGEYIIN